MKTLIATSLIVWVLLIPGSAFAHGFNSTGPGKAIFTSEFTPNVGTGSIICTETVYEWTLKGAAATLEVTPSFAKCSSSGHTTTATTSKCIFPIGSVLEPKPGEFVASMQISPSCEITFVTFHETELECKVTIKGAQSPFEGITGTNVGLGTELEMVHSVELADTTSAHCESISFDGSITIYHGHPILKGVKWV